MKTTKKDFDLFKSECEKWIKFWGLYEYSVNFIHDKRNDSDVLAFSKVDASFYWCTLGLNTNWHNRKPTAEEIRKCAFHEVCHVLLERMFFCAICRYTTDEEIRSALESIIKRMENCVFGIISL